MTWNDQTQNVILCEGYYDRAFWKGWLEHLGCSDPGAPEAGKTRRKEVFDPWKKEVKGGRFAFASKSGRFVTVIPCGGKDKVLPIARVLLAGRKTNPIDRVVINVDSDAMAGGTPEATIGLSFESVRTVAREIDRRCSDNAEGKIVLGDQTRISTIRWECQDNDAAGLPRQQTLERLACAAICEAHPDFGLCVDQWLGSRPGTTTSTAKNFAWSYFAGWYADGGCEAFYERLWAEPQLVEALRRRLHQTRAWQIAEAVAR